MGSSAEAKAIARDLVAPSAYADEIEIGQLFGGAALRMEGVVVAVVIDEVFYLVVDAEMRQELEALGSLPFSYDKADRRVVITKWYEAPAVVFEEPDALDGWIGRARDAAFIAAASTPPKASRMKKRS